MTDLELLKRETTTSTDTAVVLDGGASHNRSELVDGTGCKLSGLLCTSSTTGYLLTGLLIGNAIRFLVSFLFVLQAVKSCGANDRYGQWVRLPAANAEGSCISKAFGRPEKLKCLHNEHNALAHSCPTGAATLKAQKQDERGITWSKCTRTRRCPVWCISTCHSL